MPKGYWVCASTSRTRNDTRRRSRPTRSRSRNTAPGSWRAPGGSRPSKAPVERANAVIEFPSYQAALDCWRSPEYQEAMKLRTPVSTADPIVIEGYDGPQP
jgi:uncharacterized protein (DUF1330 family)